MNDKHRAPRDVETSFDDTIVDVENSHDHVHHKNKRMSDVHHVERRALDEDKRRLESHVGDTSDERRCSRFSRQGENRLFNDGNTRHHKSSYDIRSKVS